MEYILCVEIICHIILYYLILQDFVHNEVDMYSNVNTVKYMYLFSVQ